MQAHSIAGGGGLALHVREWGKADARPILFIHGWSQHHLCWARQVESALADEFRLVALDLRGHGQSAAPLDTAQYTDGALWAADVANVIAALALDRPVVVAWSYGGCIVGDYLRVHGDGAIAGIDFVGAAVGLGKNWLGTHIGPGILDHAQDACSEDQAVALTAIRAFLEACVATPLSREDAQLAMGWNALVQPRVRAALLAREEDFTPELAKLIRPVLVSRGEADTVILPAMAEAIRDHVRDCRASVYPGVGHAPFIEQAERFNAELAGFARRCFAAAPD